MAAAQCRSSRCTAERKEFRRELDSWRHKLIHCIGFESILEGIYGPMLLRDLNIFDDCEPEEVDDWSVEASCSHCSFCSLSLDKLSDQVPAAASPLSSPSDYSPCQAPTLSESSQSAHRFLQAVFHKQDVPLGCDSNIPMVAQELMKKMIHQFAMEYASKSHIHTTTNGFTTDTSSPPSDVSDAPLDLTVSRCQEKEKEPQPDGVLDLSKRNSACSATSSSSPNHKASGFLLPTTIEELGDPGRQETQCGHNSALEAVLCSLCRVHRSLLYQILKLAQKEQLLYHRPVCQTDSDCCHRGITAQDVTTRPFPFSECKAHNSSPHYPLIDCDHQDHTSTLYYPADSKSNCIVHHYPFNDCKSKAPQGSGCCCVQSCRVAAYPVFCLKRLHCISCQSVAVGRINSVVCSVASSPSLSQSPSLCPSSSSICPTSSVCCSHHSPHSCPCYSNHSCPAQVRNTLGGGGEGDPPCPVLKREQSPSPPPLSPIPSGINRKTEEKPPSLRHHRHEEGADPSLPLMVKDGLIDTSQQKVDLDAVTVDELECRTPQNSQAEQNPSGSLLQDVVDRFSERLETIKPIEKEPPLSLSAIHTIEKEPPLSPTASQSLQCHDDAHLSEIITTVLGTESDSDYNLSELFHHHDNNEAKSPNTRFRRRQEVLAALTTPADNASTRRHTLQIKRELAMIDQSYCRRKGPLAKRVKLKDGNNVPSATSSSSSDTTPVKEEFEREIEIPETKGLCPKQEIDIIRDEGGVKSVIVGDSSITENREIEHIPREQEGKISKEPRMEKGVEDAGVERVREGQEDVLTSEKERDELIEEIKRVIVTEEIETIKAEKREREIATEEKDQIVPDIEILTSELQSKGYNVGSKGDGLQSQTLTTTSVIQCSRGCEISGKSSNLGNDRNQEEALSGQCSGGDNMPDRGKAYHRPVRGKKTSLSSKSSHSREARKSRRSIVPPQRFSSYVTEPRKMYFVACFSESIFNQKALKDKVLKSNTLDPSYQNTDKDTQLESKKEAPLSSPDLTGKLAFESTSEKQFGTSHMESQDQSQVSPLPTAGTETSPTKHSSQNRTDLKDSAARPYGRLRSSPTKLHDSESKTISRTPRNTSKLSSASSDNSAAPCVQSPPNSHIQYISPIKLMYVSPVMDKEGVKYSLKSATSGSSGQAEEPFDPCEESSWAGTPEKNKSPGTESATLQIKSVSVSSPLKSATSPAKSASTSPKSGSSSPKSAFLSPKVSARRSGEGTPPKRAAGTENQRLPGDTLPSHETTPPKRRPGRPKKLGPQLEKKVKRPIGRPRKQKAFDQVMGRKPENMSAVLESGMEENTNKNLKITVVYGRSRRNKRLVSEGFDQLQTELCDAWQTVGPRNELSNLLHNSQTNFGSVKAASTEQSEELNLVRPVKESAPHSSSNIKCQKLDGAVPIRKPGRPAKVKISGISVTVTTVSPRQRKIHINRDARQSPEISSHKKALLPLFKSAKEPRTIRVQTSSDCSQTEEIIEAKDERGDKHSERPVAVRQSVRVRKPSFYLLHSVATSTSRSFSHSTALLPGSKQLLLSKASTERKQEEAQSGVETAVGKRQLFGQEKKHVCQDLSQVAGVSVDSIFPPRETLRWWAASAEVKTLNQELARRIRLVSDTWVSDTVENQEETTFKSRLGIKRNRSFTKKSRHSSMVRMLFDCPPNKPSSCSMQQLCSWFMQTTETQSLAIVKKASSRNPYELMHYPRSANKGSVCPSPQAERLRKHIKKFAKTVPKSPCQHQQAQERLRNRSKATDNVKRQLFTPRFAPGRLNQGAPWWRGRVLKKYSTTLLRARARFLTRKEREKWPKRQRNNQKELKWRLAESSFKGHTVTGLQPRHKAFSRSATETLFDCLENNCTTSSADQNQEPTDVPKEQRLSSKAWSPETLKECRVFLRKINSPDNESTEEEWDSCTVTLDDGSPSAYRYAGRVKELVGVVKAVKTEKKRSRKIRAASRELSGSATKSSQEQDEVPVGRKKGKHKSPGVVSAEPPPAKMLRQSRVRGLTGPRWCDYVFEN